LKAESHQINLVLHVKIVNRNTKQEIYSKEPISQILQISF
jgi:hypothetical protein